MCKDMATYLKCPRFLGFLWFLFAIEIITYSNRERGKKNRHKTVGEKEEGQIGK